MIRGGVVRGLDWTMIKRRSIASSSRGISSLEVTIIHFAPTLRLEPVTETVRSWPKATRRTYSRKSRNKVSGIQSSKVSTGAFEFHFPTPLSGGGACDFIAVKIVVLPEPGGPQI